MTLTYFTPLSKWGNIIDGEINPSLTDLKHLSHLDLRFNNFEGIPIPKFTGSLHMLHYLDLSNANFSGMIHDEIGNLSNLHYPDISGVLTSLWVRDVSWLSALSSLQYLDIGSVNITSTSHELFLAQPKSAVFRFEIKSIGPTFPSWLRNQTLLGVVMLENAGISGEMPSGLYNLFFLTTK
ncbi:hypothetical protein JHK87_036939 [Glycine soja]|nr:hypothetical protein JHK87_036939 [Glycine soja]